MTLRPLTMAIVFCLLALAGLPARAPAQDNQGAPPPQLEPNGAAVPEGQDNAQQDQNRPPKAAAAQKPGEKPKKVITNEDIEGTGAAVYPERFADVDMNHINECDRYCFELVRQAAGIPAGASVQWKRTLLEGIEKVEADGAWQARLGGLARVRGKYCELERERNADLARHNGPGTVTPGEIDIEEFYARKFSALQRELVESYDRAEAVRRKYSGLVLHFMTLQEQRISGSACANRQPAYAYPQYGGGADDPDDP